MGWGLSHKIMKNCENRRLVVVSFDTQIAFHIMWHIVTVRTNLSSRGQVFKCIKNKFCCWSFLNHGNKWVKYPGIIILYKSIQSKKKSLWKPQICVWIHESEAFASHKSFWAQIFHFVPSEDNFTKTRLVKEHILAPLRMSFKVLCIPLWIWVKKHKKQWQYQNPLWLVWKSFCCDDWIRHKNAWHTCVYFVHYLGNIDVAKYHF